MEKPPTREQVYSRLERTYPGEADFPEYEFWIMGLTAVYFDLADNGRNLTDAYRTGGLHGAVFERADDAVDGEHGFEAVEDKSRFMENLIEVLKTGEIPEGDHNSEIPAYQSAAMMNELLGDSAMDRYAGHFEDVVELENRIPEVEQTREGYRLHLESGGRTYLAMFEALSDITGYPVEGKREELEAMGKLLQSADDMLDVDHDPYPVDREDIHSIQSEIIEDLDDGRFSRKGLTAFVNYFPKAYKLADLERFV